MSVSETHPDPVDLLVEDLRKLEILDDINNNKGNNMTVGTIEDVNTKEGANYFQYRFKIDGDWYGTFTDKGKFDHIGLGDKVEFEYFEKGKYKNIKPESINVVEKASPSVAQAQSKKNDAVGERIFYSGTQKPAVELVGYLLQHDLVTLPKAKKDQMDAVLSLTQEVTEQLAHQVDVMSGAVTEETQEASNDIKE